MQFKGNVFRRRQISTINGITKRTMKKYEGFRTEDLLKAANEADQTDFEVGA